MTLYDSIVEKISKGEKLREATSEVLETYYNEGGRYVPGFGHRFHPVDPRAPRLMELTKAAADAGTIPGNHLSVALELERQIASSKGRSIPMNIDGASAVIYGELGFPPPLARGLFCLSRSVGILAHAWEQTEQGGRNKGPIPRDTIWSYAGHPPRPMPTKKP